MSFVQIGFLTALLALAIPILIHLFFRQRTRRADLGTLRFLREVLVRHARRRRILRWLLLALRMVAVAALALLFARPYWRNAQAAGQRRTQVILIDRSASMELKAEGQRLVEIAVGAARDLIAQGASNDRFQVAFFDHAVHPLSDLELQRLEPPTTCFGATNYGAAFAWARDTLTKSPPGERILHVFTDLQQSGLAWSEADTLPDDVVTHLHDLGRAAVTNLAVVEARAEPAWIRPGESAVVQSSVYNGGPFTANNLGVVLKLASRAGKVELREKVKLDPGTSASVRFQLPALAEGSWQGTVRVEADDELPADDARQVAIAASPPYQVLLLGGEPTSNAALPATHFLEAALRLAPPGELNRLSPFEPRSRSAAEPLTKLEAFDAAVLADAGELSAANRVALRRYVESGRRLVVFGGERMTAVAAEKLAEHELSVGSVTGLATASDLPWRLKTWDIRHPIFTAFSDPQVGDLARLSFTAVTQFKPNSDSRILAEFGDGLPAVVELQVGRGSVIWLAMAADRSASDWTSSRLYLPFVYQLLGYQTGLTAGGRVRQLTLDAVLTSKRDKPGIEPLDGYVEVTNMSPREAETDRATAEEFATRFGLKLERDSDLAAGAPTTAAIGTDLLESEVWPWLGGILVVTLVLETLVANRTAG